MLFTIKGKQVLVDNAYSHLLGLTANGLDSWGVTSRGHLLGRVNGKNVYLHRLIAEHAGIDVSQQIDHINRNPLDNRVSNLRPATHAQNTHNAKVQRNNVSGLKGVCFRKDCGRYQARIDYNGKTHSLGFYQTAEEAHQAYVAKAIELRGSFA